MASSLSQHHGGQPALHEEPPGAVAVDESRGRVEGAELAGVHRTLVRRDHPRIHGRLVKRASDEKRQRPHKVTPLSTLLTST